jgi:hypothetical protein
MAVGLASLSLRASEGGEAISSPKFGDRPSTTLRTGFVASAASLPSLLAMTLAEGGIVDAGEGVFVVAIAVGVLVAVKVVVGDGVRVVVGVAVGGGVFVGRGVGVAVGSGVAVGKGVGVGVAVGGGVAVLVLVGVAVGVGVG